MKFYPTKENLSSNIFPITGNGFLTSFAALIAPIIIKTNGANPTIDKIVRCVIIIKILRTTDSNIEKIIKPKDCLKWYLKLSSAVSFPEK